jgi:hypothetical protein
MKKQPLLVLAVAGLAMAATFVATRVTASPTEMSTDPDSWVNERGVIDRSRVPEWLPLAVPFAVWDGGIGYVQARALHPFAPGYQWDFDGPYPVFEREGRGKVIAWYFRSLAEPVPVGTRPQG